MNQNKTKRAAWPGGQLVEILLFIFLSPLLLCIGVAYLASTILIYLAVWLVWNTRGIHLVYVYSNSPHWQEYIEKEILPKLPDGQIVLNWSERKRWKYMSLASVVFHHFGGYREFNPMAVILRPLRRAKVFRFYEPFKDFKHGKSDTLLKMEAEFFQALRA